MQESEKKNRRQTYDGESVIDAYNDRHTIEDVLTHYGYTRAHGGRWSRPGEKDSAGVEIIKGANRTYHYSSNDPLDSDSGGLHQPRSPFDYFLYFDHRGDYKEAVKAAAIEMGMGARMNGRANGTPMPHGSQAGATSDATPQKDTDNTKLRSILLNAGINDEGNADCVIGLHGGKYLYSETLGWLHFDGRKWATDEAEAKVDRAIVATLEARVKAALQTGNMEAYSTLIKFCVPNKGRVQGCKYMLQSKVSVSYEAFDRDPDMLNCKNGVVSLRTGELTPHSCDQRFTYCTTVDYVPDADYTAWDEWLIDSLNGIFESYKYMQLAIGYSLTGHTSEEILFYLYGPPRSGKGTFTETWLALLGTPVAKEVDFGTFTAKRTGDSQNFDLAPLRPCRFVAASESNAYERFNEAKVKALTGGNEVYCAFKHRDHFSYRPQFKIWLSSNQPVNADPDDDAVWGRIRVLEFPNSHLGDEDKSLKHTMKTEKALQGALAWGVKGAIEWYALGQKGLPEIEQSRTAKDAQRNDLDNIQEFIDECCIVNDATFIAQDRLFPKYELWCDVNGVEPKKKKGLTQSLKKKGFLEGKRYENGVQKRGIVGIGFNKTD